MCIKSRISNIILQKWYESLKNYLICDNHHFVAEFRAVVLADSRYNRQDKRSKFPPWITQFLGESALNLSVDVAVAQVRKEEEIKIEKEGVRRRERGEGRGNKIKR